MIYYDIRLAFMGEFICKLGGGACCEPLEYEFYYLVKIEL